MGTSRVGKILTALMVTASFDVAPSIAQPTALQLALCKRITEDAARLKCFDQAFESKEPEKSEDTPAPGSWKVSESKSPVDDKSEVSAILAANDSKSGLFARCKNNATELFVMHVSTYIGSSDNNVRVTLRINDLPAVTENWSGATGGKGAFSKSAVRTLKLLPDQANLFVRMFDFQGVPHDATFALGNLSQIREMISATCKWRPDTPAKAKR